MKLYYVLVNHGGVELDKLGPYNSDQERDEVAKKTWAECEQDSSTVHYLNVDLTNPGDPVSVGEYSNGELEDDDGDG